MKITKYEILTEKKGTDKKFAVVSDLHARPYRAVIDALKSVSPDAILLPGDIVEIAVDYMEKRNKYALEFLREAAAIAPTYYCYGNHEIFFSHAKGGRSKTPDKKLGEEYLEKIISYGVHIINDDHIAIDDTNTVYVCGLVCGRDMDPAFDEKMPSEELISKFEELDGFKILLCHYPHYYEKYLKDRDIDLVLSGHAHGGQWRIFGRGVYAPHQGLFPKYTSGMHDGKHIISRGSVNNVSPIPRFFNPCEILEITIKSK